MIRFKRAKGRCEHCRRPHGQRVHHLGDGRWWDQEPQAWRDDRGRILGRLPIRNTDLAIRLRTTRVVLATAHLDHDPSNNDPRNLKAFCQRCHMLHDAPEHRRRRWLTYHRRKAMGDLFLGPYPSFH